MEREICESICVFALEKGKNRAILQNVTAFKHLLCLMLSLLTHPKENGVKKKSYYWPYDNLYEDVSTFRNKNINMPPLK